MNDPSNKHYNLVFGIDLASLQSKLTQPQLQTNKQFYYRVHVYQDGWVYISTMPLTEKSAIFFEVLNDGSIIQADIIGHSF